MAALEPTGIFDGVHIRFCGNGLLGFRPYGESLLANAVRVKVPVALLLQLLARCAPNFRAFRV